MAMPMRSDQSPDDVFYPESDGAPMGENPYQAEVIIMVKLGFQRLFRGRPDVWVGADNFWYPVRGEPAVVAAPDTMVVVDLAEQPDIRTMGSYRPWVHGGRVSLVVEVLSPSNTWAEMLRKRRFYELHGVDEYWVFDPETAGLEVWVREDGRLCEQLVPADGHVSPATGVRVGVVDGSLAVFDPGTIRRWLPGYEELARAEAEAARAEAEAARARAAEQRIRDLEARIAALEGTASA